MNSSNNPQPAPTNDDWTQRTVLWILVGLAVMAVAAIGGALLAAFFQVTPAGQQTGSFLQWLLVPDPTHLTWYLTRAAGFTAYLLLWLSTLWGVAIPTRILDGKLHGAFTFEFHQFISLLSIAFTALHVVVLLFDQYTPFSLAQVLIPFTSSYRPLWTGLGIIGLYVMLLVTVTFYLRNRIGSKNFRSIHLLSYLAFFGTALHGLLAGSDTSLPAVRWLYAGSVLSVVFLTTYWLIGVWGKKRMALNHQPSVVR